MEESERGPLPFSPSWVSAAILLQPKASRAGSENAVHCAGFYPQCTAFHDRRIRAVRALLERGHPSSGKHVSINRPSLEVQVRLRVGLGSTAKTSDKARTPECFSEHPGALAQGWDVKVLSDLLRRKSLAEDLRMARRDFGTQSQNHGGVGAHTQLSSGFARLFHEVFGQASSNPC